MLYFSQRYGDPESAFRYPLPVSGNLSFAHEGEHLVAEIALPDLPAETIIAASFVTPGAWTPLHRFVLVTTGHTWPLLPVPSTRGERPDRGDFDAAVSTHIDCWHTQADLSGATVRLLVEAPKPPERYLLALSARPLSLPPDLVLPPSPLVPVHARTPGTQSQMTAADAIRRHICSPASVAMLIPGALRDEIAETCRDPATGMFGSWPMAVRAAAAHGAVAAVELHVDWQNAERVLAAGHSFAASIRFAEGALRGAPLSGTGGHLVVVHGIERDTVLVHDPAAETDAQVPRRYDAAEFSQAWLAMRGASYIIAP